MARVFGLRREDDAREANVRSFTAAAGGCQLRWARASTSSAPPGAGGSRRTPRLAAAAARGVLKGRLGFGCFGVGGVLGGGGGLGG